MWTSVKLAAAAVVAASAAPGTSHAQALANNHYQRSSMAQQDPLPPGFHDFRPIPPDHRRIETSGYRVLCRDMPAAISFGKRLALGLPSHKAVHDISARWGGAAPCGYASNLTLTPIAFAIRGDDASRRISIVMWRDQYNRLHFTGSPKTDECGLEQPDF
jgi:hypothetical protein